MGAGLMAIATIDGTALARCETLNRSALSSARGSIPTDVLGEHMLCSESVAKSTEKTRERGKARVPSMVSWLVIRLKLHSGVFHAD